MTKYEFVTTLTHRLSHLPREAVEERVNFYIESIEDRIEDGVPEEEAVAAVGSPEEIAAQIMGELPRPAFEVPRKEQKRRPSAVETVLLILGAPIWLSLLIAAFAVVLSVYISLWAVIISLWAIFASFVGCALGGIVGGTFLAFTNGASGVFLIGAGLFCAGASVLLFHGCKAATKGAVWLCVYPVKKLFGKGGACDA